MYEKIKYIIETKLFQNFIVAVILFNGITMGMETSKNIMEQYGYIINMTNIIVLTIFVIEITMRIYVYKKEFFKDGWSLFDFFIVAISLIPVSEGYEILRVLRVLRLFRLVTVIPQMRKIVLALAAVIPGMASIGAILTLFFYVFAIMATQLYGEDFPQWFGTLGESFYTLFQLMTLESWSMGIVRPIMEVQPLAWLFFIPFIFMATFIIINLMIAIVVDAMALLNNKEEEHIVDEIHHNETSLKDEITSLKKDIDELKTIILAQNNNKSDL
ncbi:MAG: ion transporter [Campylobacterota bacterium]|nr:ion transporter [Campylobacterota bacterium]